jgi:rod shape determining protein RodA
VIRWFRQYAWNAIRKSDLILLLLCGLANAFGLLMIATTTNYRGTLSFVERQLLASVGGVFLYFFISSLNIDSILERRRILYLVMYGLILLLIPFGADNGSGNKSWIDIDFLPFFIQPAEIAKIFLILVCAAIMGARQNRPSAISSVMRSFFPFFLLFALNLGLSGDLGVSVIFVVIYVVMALAGGISFIWFAIAGGGLAVALPFLWRMLDGYQKNRFLILFDPSIDPLGISERYHTMRSLKSLTGGGLFGQGLFNGNRTQTYGVLPAQHTDFIFSAIGEELGYIGCIFTIVLLFLIVARVIWVGVRSPDYTRKLICFGAGAALIFQIVINVGMCMGVMPVIGLTLPLISYGGSSTVTIYAMLGLVSGVYARPAPKSYERYIQPPL